MLFLIAFLRKCANGVQKYRPYVHDPTNDQKWWPANGHGMRAVSCRILVGDVLDKLSDLPDGSVHCCVTSPPYWGLRDYGMAGQIGLEATPEQFAAKMVEVFCEVRRVLRPDGTLWMSLATLGLGARRDAKALSRYARARLGVWNIGRTGSGWSDPGRRL